MQHPMQKLCVKICLTIECWGQIPPHQYSIPMAIFLIDTYPIGVRQLPIQKMPISLNYYNSINKFLIPIIF